MNKPRLNTIYSAYVATLVLFFGFTVITIFWAGYGTILAESAEPQRQQVKAILSHYHNEISLGQYEALESDLKLQLVRLELGEIAIDFKAVGKRLTVVPAMSTASSSAADIWSCRDINELVFWDIFSPGCLATSVSMTYGPDSKAKLVEARWQAGHAMENVRAAAFKMIVLFILVALVMTLFSHLILSSRIIDPLAAVINSLKDASQKQGLDQTIRNLDGLEARSFEMALLQNRLKEYLEEVQRFYDQKSNLARGKARAEVAESLAHDIRSPVGALRIVLQKLAKDSDASQDIIELGQKALARIENITHSILKKEEESKNSVNDFDADIKTAKLLDGNEILETIRDLSHEKRLVHPDLKLDLAYDINTKFRTYFSANAISRILSNTINNAIESYADSSPQVWLRLSLADGYLSIRVIDRGSGMESHLVEKLGRAPIQDGEKSFKPGSSGIALFHAQRILVNLGGSLKFSSMRGAGTTAEIRLPLVIANNPAISLDGNDLSGLGESLRS